MAPSAHDAARRGSVTRRAPAYLLLRQAASPAQGPADAFRRASSNTTLGNGTRRRRGKVFADRYHVEVITTPTRARHAISYCLSNWRKHGEDRDGLPSTWLVDAFSSGISFPD